MVVLVIVSSNQRLLVGTWNGIKQNVTARHRTKKMMPWKLVESIWRRKHDDDWWGGIMKALSCVQVTPANGSEDHPPQSLLTEVIDQDGQDEDGFESLINTILEGKFELLFYFYS